MLRVVYKIKHFHPFKQFYINSDENLLKFFLIEYDCSLHHIFLKEKLIFLSKPAFLLLIILKIHY